MSRKIERVAVLGGGIMGSGIAGACAQAGHRVLLLDVSKEAAEMGLERMVSGRSPVLDDAEKVALVTLGTFDDDFAKVADCDWICEAVIEDLDTKRALFERLEPLRRDGSVVSTNTSGIMLRDITSGMPERLRRDIAVTHFFNPVKLMKLVELVPGEDTTADVIEALTDFCGDTLGKGVVRAKDTVNFIGNRIGCFCLLAGLHQAAVARQEGLAMEDIDALMGAPVGLPPTGLYGLIDLIGLDVMDLVARNLAANLPAGDACHAHARLPPAEQAMVERGQLGRKTGGGFYKVIKHADGSRSKEVYDLDASAWRAVNDVTLADAHTSYATLLFADDAQGRFAWDVIGGTLAYAAGLVPEISDDVVSIDRVMRWGYAWKMGPFEFLDALGPAKVIAKLDSLGQPVPRMLAVLRDAGADGFYRDHGAEFLGLDGAWHPVPRE